MKVRVTLEFENPLHSSLQEIHYLLMDALAEFQSARHHNGESYVNKRYPGNDVYTGERREEKIRQVNRRIFTAEQMRNSLISTEYVVDSIEE